MARLTAAEICRAVDGKILNAALYELPKTLTSVEEVEVVRPAPLEEAGTGHIAFFFSKLYQSQLLKTRASIVLTGQVFAEPLLQAKIPQLKSTLFIASSDPYWAMAKVSELLAMRLEMMPQASETSKIHATAVVSPDAVIGKGVCIGPHCVVEAGARLGDHTTLVSQVYIGPRVQIGQNCTVFSGVQIYEDTVIENRVRIHSGTVIGADGFGYAPKIENQKVVAHQKIWHFGRVHIEDDVEIGALCTLDRATFGETRIQKGAKLDNMVHLGYNSQVGEGAILRGGVGLAGTASVGKFVYLGGKAGVNNRTHVGDYAKVAGMSQVTKNVPEGAEWGGYPARDIREYTRQQVYLQGLYKKSQLQKGNK